MDNVNILVILTVFPLIVLLWIITGYLIYTFITEVILGKNDKRRI